MSVASSCQYPETHRAGRPARLARNRVRSGKIVAIERKQADLDVAPDWATAWSCARARRRTKSARLTVSPVRRGRDEAYLFNNRFGQGLTHDGQKGS
jgi:hypothetical protein